MPMACFCDNQVYHGRAAANRAHVCERSRNLHQGMILCVFVNCIICGHYHCYLASLKTVGLLSGTCCCCCCCFHVVYCAWLQCYMNEMMNCGGQLPPGIAGREDTVFGNIVEIHEFHKKSVD